jgi:hypothetical protein
MTREEEIILALKVRLTKSRHLRDCYMVNVKNAISVGNNNSWDSGFVVGVKEEIWWIEDLLKKIGVDVSPNQ